MLSEQASIATVSHTAVVTSSDADLAEQLVPALRGALALGLPATANLAAERIELLQQALGADAAAVRWSDTNSWVPHPARRLRAFESMLCRGADGRSLFVGECAWPMSGLPEVYREWERFDAVLDELVVESGMSLICVYDRRQWPDAEIERVGRAHRQLGLTPPRPNPEHLPARSFLAATAPRELAIPPGAEQATGSIRPPEARAFVYRAASLLRSEWLEELSVVVSELITNSWRAGATTVTVSCWSDEAGVALQVDDDGCGLHDELAGYRPPPGDSVGGRGLWITRQLADLVEIAPRSPGTSVRVRPALEPRVPTSRPRASRAPAR